jgi:hypothetical protein
MSLSNPVSRRALRHTRAIAFQALAPLDGPWNCGAHDTPIKVHDTLLASRFGASGQPRHALLKISRSNPTMLSLLPGRRAWPG